MEKGMASAGIIMLVTGGGGALGQIIKDSGLGSYIAEVLVSSGIPVIILPFVIATLIRFIQGSGTVAMTTAASITAAIVAEAGGNPYMAALACCVGSLFFSYFNDSYFWVVTNFGAMSPEKGYKTQTVCTLLLGIAGIVEIMLLSLFLH